LAATPVITGGNGVSLRLQIVERPAFSLEELIEQSFQGEGWSLQLACERDLHDRQQRRLKELNAPEILIRNWESPEAVNLAEVTNQPWPEPPQRLAGLRCADSSDIALIVLIPTVRPWEAAAYFGFGGFNACPAPWVHVAYAREWSARFGARALSLTHHTLEFEVARRIASREDAAAMAAVHARYCSDTYPSMVEHAAYLLGARLWQFWWD
jgi:hypothetical protein